VNQTLIDQSVKSCHHSPLVSNRLIIKVLLKILGANGSEDYGEVFDTQSVIDQPRFIVLYVAIVRADR
jgi:hypothetical protein